VASSHARRASKLILLIWLARAPRRQPRPSRSHTIASGAVLLLICGLGYLWYQLPLLGVIPPEQIVAGATGGIPEPLASATATKEQASLAARGRYLYTVASCALCHGNDGRGGLKISWKPMGTLWSRNITPDLDTGLGRWSDAQIARAIRSGVSRDGYVLHWQGMIWDHASNWDEEDIRALVVYLRAMPPVSNKVVPDRAPSADDCEVYTFWTSPSTVPGCH